MKHEAVSNNELPLKAVRLVNWWQGIVSGFSVFAGWLLFIITLIITANVVGRYFLQHALFWTEEISKWLTIGVIFFAIAAAELHEEHIHVDLVTSRLQPKPKAILALVAAFLSLVFMVCVTWAACQGTINAVQFGQYGEHVRVSLAPLKGAIALGCLLLVGQLVITNVKARLSWLRLRQPQSTKEIPK